MLNFCDFIQVYVFTRNHHLKSICLVADSRFTSFHLAMICHKKKHIFAFIGTVPGRLRRVCFFRTPSVSSLSLQTTEVRFFALFSSVVLNLRLQDFLPFCIVSFQKVPKAYTFIFKQATFQVHRNAVYGLQLKDISRQCRISHADIRSFILSRSCKCSDFYLPDKGNILSSRLDLVSQ